MSSKRKFGIIYPKLHKITTHGDTAWMGTILKDEHKMQYCRDPNQTFHCDERATKLMNIRQALNKNALIYVTQSKSSKYGLHQCHSIRNNTLQFQITDLCGTSYFCFPLTFKFKLFIQRENHAVCTYCTCTYSVYNTVNIVLIWCYSL